MTINKTPQSPYFGSFERSKKYIRVLFKPEHAVQARELNDAQVITQDQISMFADHIFKNGSKVSNARSNMLKVSYVRLQNKRPDGSEVDLTMLKEGEQIVGDVSGVKAVLVDFSKKDSTDPHTLFVQYQTTAIDGETSTFVPGETLSTPSGKVVVKCPGCPDSEPGEIYPLGKALQFVVDEGIFYYNGAFVTCDRQKKIVVKYPWPDKDAPASTKIFSGVKIGLEYIEEYIDSDKDAELLDNCLGYANEGLPGADRLKADFVLTMKPYTAESGDNFIVLAKVDEEGRIEYMKSDAEYSAIMDDIARRTFETNGNYTVRPFKLNFLNHKRAFAGDPFGWSETGDDKNLVAVVTPSVGYVLGYRTETIADTAVIFPKARETKRNNGSIIGFSERAYVVMTPGDVVWPNPATDVGLFSAQRVSLMDAVAGGGNQIGSFLVYNISLHSGTPNTPGAAYRYYFTDLQMAPGKTMNDVKSAIAIATNFQASPVLENNKFEVKNPLNTQLIYKLPFSNVKTLRTTDPANPGSMIMTVRKKVKATLNASGSATITAATNQSFAAVSSSSIGFLTTPANVTKPLNMTGPGVASSSNEISFSLGAAEAGNTVTAIIDVLVTNQTQNTKTSSPHIKTTASPPPHDTGSKVKLGEVDVYELTKVSLYDYNDPANPFMIKDVTSDWKLENGSTDSSYNESFIVKQSTSTPFNSTYRLRMEFKSFTHSGNAGFYTVDSYAQMLVPDASGKSVLSYETIPVYKSKTSSQYVLSSCLDFRPDLLAGSTLEPVVPANSSTAIYAIEYYLGRADLLCLKRDGTMYVKLGLSSDSPQLPDPDSDAMALYQIWSKPYVYNLSDISTKFIENKRYTMRDIGNLEKRIGNLEYYTLLTMLEQQTASMTTKDSAGLDRYKNGFLVDDFSGLKASDLQSPEYRAGVDTKRMELRPSFKTRSVKLAINRALSQNVKWLGDIGLRDYDSIIAIEQPFATKTVSINPYFQVAKMGKLVLEPNMDVWSDDTILPPVVTEIDSGVEALRGVAEAAGILGTTWGSWAFQNTTLVSSDVKKSSQVESYSQINDKILSQSGYTENRVSYFTSTVETIKTNRTDEIVNTTTTNVFNDNYARTGFAKTVDSRTQTYTSGETVRDVKITPFVREGIVKFYATSMKPNTRVYAFFDGEPISEHCRTITVVATGDKLVIDREFMAFGSPLYTDKNGELFGEFKIPKGKFFTGQKSLRLTSDKNFNLTRNNKGDEDDETTYSEALYFAGGLDVTKQEAKLNIITPVYNSKQVSETRSDARTQTSTSQVRNILSQSSESLGVSVRHWESVDPVAQSFVLPDDCFITQIDVFFSQVDKVNNKFWVELRSMINGYPSTEVLSHKDFVTDDVKVSEDATAVFKTVFDYPVFVRSKTEYCFVVGGYSPDTRLWVARMGGRDVTNPDKTVETQPSLGSSFRSQNGSTWNAEQFEDLKHNIHIAKFKDGEMKLVFESEKVDYENLEENPIETQTGSSRVRIHHLSHGFVENDKVKLNLKALMEFEVETDAGFTPPHIGQTISTSTGTGKIKEVLPQSSTQRYIIKLEKVFGKFEPTQAWTTDSIVPFTFSYLLDDVSKTKTQQPRIPGGKGTVITGSHKEFIGGAVNGIPVDLLQREHTVVAVDSTRSYIIEVGTPALASGRSGGKDCGIEDTSVRFDVINTSGSTLAYGASETWELRTIGHGKAGSLFVNDNYRQLPPIYFNLGSDIHLSQPSKLANSNGEKVNNVKSIVSTCLFKNYPTEYVSPVVNASAFSSILITNNIDFEDANIINVAPNAAGRFIPETDPTNGTSAYKYPTVIARLQNPAEDLRVLFDAYCDVNAEFDIYVKFFGPSDSGSIDDKPWQKFKLKDFVPSVDLSDMKEHDLITHDDMPGWVNEPFIAFKLKIVGRSHNSCKPPIFKNLRIMAVT